MVANREVSRVTADLIANARMSRLGQNGEQQLQHEASITAGIYITDPEFIRLLGVDPAAGHYGFPVIRKGTLTLLPWPWS